MGADNLAQDAAALDAADEISAFRKEFNMPIFEAVGADLVDAGQSKETCTYLCGNSLGALAKRSQKLIAEELQVWGTRAVDGHFNHPHNRPWLPIAESIAPSLANLIGAEPNEVACMGTLTANLHLMMTSFYKPTKERFKIICEAKAFPSDRYAFHSQTRLHGFDPSVAVVEIAPRKGEFTLREEDILATIKQHGPSTALVLLSGIQFYSGQWFPMESVTKAGHDEGAIVGWDLAHAIGNVPIKLHEWNVDFAVWCSYKYLNSGPGGIGGLFVHSKWDDVSPPQLHGWWGHDPPTRFDMPHNFKRTPGAAGYQQSNPSALLVASLMGSLELFNRVPGGLPALRERSVRLTAYLEMRLKASKWYFDVAELSTTEGSEKKRSPAAFTIITPSTPSSRGAQLSMLWPAGLGAMQRVFKGLKRRGVIGDEREPDIIRLAPAPLYNWFGDCERAARMLEEVLEEVGRERQA